MRLRGIASGQMRAGVYRGKGRVVVEQVPIPEIGEGEVLFRVAACGICGTDIKKIHHGFIAPPQILGHELAGTVVRVGARRQEIQAGRSRGELPSHSLRRLLLLRAETFLAVRGLQEVGPDGGLRSERRRLCRVRARDAVDRRARNDRVAGGCELRGSNVRRAGEHVRSRRFAKRAWLRARRFS